MDDEDGRGRLLRRAHTQQQLIFIFFTCPAMGSLARPRFWAR